MAGCDQIVGVDLNPSKVEMATKFGMTDFVNPQEVKEDMVPFLVNLTKGGADYTFDATGNVDVMRTLWPPCTQSDKGGKPQELK
mgnify:CR=1 FL=1